MSVLPNVLPGVLPYDAEPRPVTVGSHNLSLFRVKDLELSSTVPPYSETTLRSRRIGHIYGRVHSRLHAILTRRSTVETWLFWIWAVDWD